MAQILSSKKRIRQNVKQRARNRWRKDLVKQAIKDFEQSLQGDDPTEATEKLKTAYKRLDMIAARGTIHKNAVARKKSQLAKMLNKTLAEKS